MENHLLNSVKGCPQYRPWLRSVNIGETSIVDGYTRAIAIREIFRVVPSAIEAIEPLSNQYLSSLSEVVSKIQSNAPVDKKIVEQFVKSFHSFRNAYCNLYEAYTS